MSLIKLPQILSSAAQPLEQLLAQRRCVREYAARPVTLAHVATLLWSAQGISSADGLRTAPSAGALYPMDVYLATGAVTGLVPGIYRYLPANCAIEQTGTGDRRAALVAAALDQTWLAEAALILIVTARYERTTGKYGRRGIQYVHMEAGHAAQNVLLTAVALDLAAAVVGAFDEGRVASVTGLSVKETPLYLVPVGYPARPHE